jgi:hypothetical protein
VTKERLLTELARVGYANTLDYITVDPSGLTHIDLSSLTREQAAAIQEVNIETITRVSRGQEEPETVTKIRLKLHSKVVALEQLGRHLGLFTDKILVEDVEEPNVARRREAGVKVMLALLEEKSRGPLAQPIVKALAEWTGAVKHDRPSGASMLGGRPLSSAQAPSLIS